MKPWTKHALWSAAAALAPLTLCAVATAAIMVPENIGRAIADPARPAADRERDTARKPAEMLTFAKVRPGEKVVDLMPGAGYFTRLFSVAVGPKGKVFAFIPTEVEKFEKGPTPANGSSPDARYPNVVYLVAPIADFATPEKVDMIWTSQNYHDLHDPFMGPVDMKKFDKAVYDALKPGGLFVVEDHAAMPGSGVSATNTLHRIDPAVVKQEVTSVGFKFDGESKVLRNPADPHTIKVFDPSIRGHTDQFVYRFRKPG